MNYQETVQYIFSKTVAFQRVGQSAYKEDLENIKVLCKHLNHPEKAFQSIHIGGTNGKGSTASILTSVLVENNLNVGKFTSPHYFDFRERIQIGNEFISETDVIEFIEKTKLFIEEIRPSFFEITTAMAFWYFQKEQVDIAVIEVGLGGRLDSTNIISPILSVITNISIDHQAILGNTIEEIANEKAGIIKPNTPVIIGKTQEKSQSIFQKAAAQNHSTIHFADQELKLTSSYLNVKEGIHKITLHNKQNEIHLSTSLFGHYQQENIQTAYRAFQTLQPMLQLKQNSFQNGLTNLDENTFFIGRFQLLSKKPLTITDSCHNLDGIRTFLNQIETIQYQQLYIVYGCVSDKDASKIIEQFPKDAHLVLTEPSIPRKMSVTQLEKIAQAKNRAFTTFTNVKSAINFCKKQATKEDLIVVIGSIFLIADVLNEKKHQK